MTDEPEDNYCLECGAELDGSEDFEDVCSDCDSLWDELEDDDV